jgi:hypothetical protein
MKPHPKSQKSRTSDGVPRDYSRTPRAKSRTLARKQQRARKRAMQGRA